MNILQVPGASVSAVKFPDTDANVGDSQTGHASGARWNGESAAVYVRNSRPVQRGNNRSHWQLDLASYLRGMGYAVKLYNEQGASGARLTGRDIAAQMIADLKAGAVTCFAVAELSRLTRDGRGFDARYLAECLVRHARGKLITYDKTYDLRRIEDWDEYERFVSAAAW
jgi:hypothetical protein